MTMKGFYVPKKLKIMNDILIETNYFLKQIDRQEI